MGRKTPRPTLRLSSHQARHAKRCRGRNRETAPSSLPLACFGTLSPRDSQLTAPQTRPSASAHDDPTDHRTGYQRKTQSHLDPVRLNIAHPRITHASPVPCSEKPSPSPARQWHGKMQTPFNTSYEVLFFPGDAVGYQPSEFCGPTLEARYYLLFTPRHKGRLADLSSRET